MEDVLKAGVLEVTVVQAIGVGLYGSSKGLSRGCVDVPVGRSTLCWNESKTIFSTTGSSNSWPKQNLLPCEIPSNISIVMITFL